MILHDVPRALRRFWWLVVLGALTGAVVAFVVTPPPAWTAEFRATVLIPGDTEDTGSSERPELMVLDDLPPFIGSFAFAELVAEQAGEPVEDLYGSISGSRYSRIATVQVTADDADNALARADAAAALFPAAVNANLVAPGDLDATVRTIDPPLEATRDVTGRWMRVAAAGFLGAALGLAAAVLLTPEGQGRRGPVADSG